MLISAPHSHRQGLGGIPKTPTKLILNFEPNCLDFWKLASRLCRVAKDPLASGQLTGSDSVELTDLVIFLVFCSKMQPFTLDRCLWRITQGGVHDFLWPMTPRRLQSLIYCRSGDHIQPKLNQKMRPQHADADPCSMAKVSLH